LGTLKFCEAQEQEPQLGPILIEDIQPLLHRRPPLQLRQNLLGLAEAALPLAERQFGDLLKLRPRRRPVADPARVVAESLKQSSVRNAERRKL
jgi:hypothetical protein